ncbi:MAG: hypothetical protein WD751_04075 [Anaerolineales bacterium]
MNQNQPEKRRGMLNSRSHRFALANCALLAGFLVACSPAAPTPTVTSQPTATATAEPTLTPTDTPTPEPTSTPTEEPIVETPRTDVQEWWAKVEAEAARFGCEAKHEIVNVRETGIVNAIPWTVDQKGETIRGMIPILCGTGYYMEFNDVGTGAWSGVAEEIREGGFRTFAAGPTHVLRRLGGPAVGAPLFPNVFLDGLSADRAESLQRFFECRNVADGYFPTLIIESSEELARALTTIGVIPMGDYPSGCLP